MKEGIKPWEMRYVVRYAGSLAASDYRPLARNILESLARLKEVQHVWVQNVRMTDYLEGEDTLSDLYTHTDLLYLRARQHPTIGCKQFHQIVDAVFPDHQLGSPVTVDRIAQRLLIRLPFPL